MVTKEYAHYSKRVCNVLGLVGLQETSENSAKGIIGAEVWILYRNNVVSENCTVRNSWTVHRNRSLKRKKYY